MNHVEVKVLVPEPRLAEFYQAYADWLSHSVNATAPGASTRRGRTSSYAGLGQHLASQNDDAVILGFDEIETILSRELPASAYRHRAWWANTESHSQAAEWLQRGWRASDLDLERQQVTFRRN